MFLVDSSQAASDWDGIIDTVKNILAKADAEIISLKKWADRRLTYPINHKAKGTYILCYFKADGGKIQDIERDVQLTERIMRALILSVDKQMLKQIEKDVPQIAAEKSEAEAAVGTVVEQADGEDTK
jgi:small subunit ribosomal protein S6